MKFTRTFCRAAVAAGAIAALAAPSALAAPQMVANVMPGPTALSPSGGIATQRLDCAATDPAANLVRIEIECWTTKGAEASATGERAAAVDETDYVGGGTGIAFTSFTFCATATSYYADGSTATTGPGCAQDDFGFATVL
jgi:hypothetical protein